MSNVQYFPNQGIVTISTANPFLDGSGALGTVLTAANNGTRITSVTVKATGTTSQGMVRLFIGNGVNKFLAREIMIPANVQTGVVQAFSATVYEPIILRSGYILYASTQNAETFNVTADGTNWNNCSCPS